MVVINDVIINSAVHLALNAMMGMRIYAILGKSRRVLYFIGVCFIATQVTAIVLALLKVFPLHVTTSSTSLASPEEGDICETWTASRKAWYQSGSLICLVVYETIMFLMSLVVFVRNALDETQRLTATSKTLMGIIIRDNMLYFLAAFLGLSLTVSSNIISIVVPSANTVSHLWYHAFTVFTTVCSALYQVLLGPLMMLSIREYDFKHVNGGGTSGNVEMGTLKFATAAWSQTGTADISSVDHPRRHVVSFTAPNCSLSLSYLHAKRRSALQQHRLEPRCKPHVPLTSL
ncbi:hypothetical protein CONPUDRAFT_158557 [Coniophora puteana RWD-64-598 SS2]|uniref:Uncharacterized protein n=1 Tax=Coniophora puteana (strain RWD-64-598) TaxID=741705 RepID=A0A5M3MAX3_CONPW|nr:uncharacterized protein CONPUDRAFT_158557 [Coniophora puteana RWD-64-598 SS2]EIW75765.1 hypothetical protein CONPUDRAFT_158557 [Coniophora puteana RWD-64-598 SS2]